MEIKVQEIKKIISSPIVTILTVIFILFNMIIISQSTYAKEDLKAINSIISEFGYEIDDEIIKSMNIKFDNSLEEINKITKDKLNKTYKSVSDFFESDEYSANNHDEGIFSKEELVFFTGVNLLGLYSNLSVDLVDSYENINIKQVGESQIEAYGLSGKAAEMARKNYEKLAERFEEIKDNKEHKNLFFLGQLYKMHSLLFRNIFSKCIYEIMIVVVLMSAYLINYEFDNKTNLLVYSTKRGRNNIKDKLVVCISSSLIISTIILGVTLISYFITFDYSEVLRVPITTAFNWEYNLPYFSWFSNTFISQLILSILLVLISAVIFTVIAFIVASLVKNSYIVFFIFFIIFGVFIIVPTMISPSSPFMLYSYYNIFNLILNPHMWFMDMGPLAFKYYEVITIATSLASLTFFSICAVKRFKKEDIQ